MMNDMLIGGLVWLAGLALGAFFFGGLWWTVGKCLSSQRPALWLLSSLLLRVSVTLAGFYLVSGNYWQRWALCLLGFVMARQAMTFWLGPAEASGVRHAP